MNQKKLIKIAQFVGLVTVAPYTWHFIGNNVFDKCLTINEVRGHLALILIAADILFWRDQWN